MFASGAILVEADVSRIEYSTVTSDGEVLPVTYFHLVNVDAGEAVVATTLRLLLPGGVMGEYRVRDLHVPVLEVGDHVAWFGRVDARGVLRSTSWDSGAFRRVSDGGLDVVGDARGDGMWGMDCDAAPQRARDQAPTAWGDFVSAARACAGGAR